jgi:hypothetical protein
MSEVTPVVDDQEMLRAYAETIKLKDAEIEQLRGVVEDLSDHGVATERMERLKAQGKEIERLKALLAHAADALEVVASYASGNPDAYSILRLAEQQLIAELRKAAQ